MWIAKSKTKTEKIYGRMTKAVEIAAMMAFNEAIQEKDKNPCSINISLEGPYWQNIEKPCDELDKPGSVIITLSLTIKERGNNV